MKVSVLCTDKNHPVVARLRTWFDDMTSRGHDVVLCHDKGELPGGDILFLVSCSQVIHSADRATYRAVLVLHASDVPRGRGWSPHIWQILRGVNEITVCMLEADDPVDTGAVWLRRRVHLEGHELFNEINDKLFYVEISMMTEAVERFDEIESIAQTGEAGPSYRKRTPDDSRLDPHKTIAEQFDLLRVADPDRYPAFLDYRGKRYLIKIEKAQEHE